METKLPRAFWFLWTGSVVNRIGSFIGPFLAIYLTDVRGMTVTAAGTILTLHGAGSLLAGPIGGALADRIGRRPAMFISLVLGSAAMLNLGFARSPTHIFIAAPILGLCADLYRPAVHAAVADLVPVADRPRAFGWLYWGVNLGWAAAAVIAGSLSKLGFTTLFVIDAVSTLVFGAVILLGVPETRTPRSETQARSRTEWFVRDPLLYAFLGAQLIVALIFMQSSAALPLDARRHGISPATWGALIAINGVIIVALQPWWIRHVARFDRARVLMAAAVTTGLGFGMVSLSFHPAMIVASIIVWTLGEILNSSVVQSTIADLSPADQRGRYGGMFQLMFGMSLLGGPAIGTRVLEHHSGALLWRGCAVAGVIAALCIVPITPALRRRLLQANRA